MLSRALNRLLQSATLRSSLATPAIRLPSSQWTRSMARHNKPTQPSSPAPKKPIDFNKSSNSKVGGASAVGKPSQPRQDGSSTGTGASKVEEQELPFSEKQAEFKTDAEPSQNTENLTENASKDASSTEPAWTGPLPDLTKGIPSTLDFEMNKARKAALNLTEAEDADAEYTGTGRTKGELPASAYVSSSEKRRLKFANYMYGGFAVMTTAGLFYLGRNWETEEEENRHAEKAPSGWGFSLMWNRIKARWDDQLGYYTEPTFTKLLPDPNPMFERPYTLVFSLEDLLIHSEWSREHGWRLAKRPGMDYFLRYLSQYYELVLWTSQPYGLVEGILRKLDPFHIITWPLFREATRYEGGEYVKDLNFLNRDLNKVIMVDTVAAHAKANPENSIILPKWKGELGDKELVSLIPFLEYIHTMNVPDVRKAIQSFDGTHIPTEFAKREAIARKKFEEQLAVQKAKAPKRGGIGSIGKSLGIKPQNMMADPSEMTAAEAFAQGKMLQDLAREIGQKRYEALEKDIRENGEKWLKEEAELIEKDKEEQMKAMKSGVTGFFGNPSK